MKKQWLGWFRREKKKAVRLVSDPVAVVRTARAAADLAERERGAWRPLDRLWDDLQTTVRLVRAWGGRDYRGVARSTMILIVGALLYFVSPVDAIFDGIPVLGFVDDAAVLTWVLGQTRAELNAFREWEHEREAERALPGSDAGPAPAEA